MYCYYAGAVEDSRCRAVWDFDICYVWWIKSVVYAANAKPLLIPAGMFVRMPADLERMRKPVNLGVIGEEGD